MLVEPAPPIASLYVHVPFCARKCEYCAFYSEPAGGELMDRYVKALLSELAWTASDLKPKTVFFGGGTPSLLNVQQWAKIFQAMEKLDLLGAEEWSIECNPATVSPEKLRLWRAYGVNRVSMGVQSFTPALLQRLGRIHTRKMAYHSFELLRQSGFDNINLDLMFAIPGQTLEMWRHTLAEAMALQPEHLSCYEVIYEEDTPLYQQLKAGQCSADEDLACAMYEELLEHCAREGFVQYEVSNFARSSAAEASLENGVPPRACRHNINYWRGGAYAGLGPSAASYVRGARTQNWANTPLYCRLVEKGERPVEFREELPPLQRAGELAAFGLRMNAGWPLAEFQKRTGYDLRQEWKAEVEQLIAQHWAVLEAERFHLTRQGMRFADAAAEMFLR